MRVWTSGGDDELRWGGEWAAIAKSCVSSRCAREVVPVGAQPAFVGRDGDCSDEILTSGESCRGCRARLWAIGTWCGLFGPVRREVHVSKRVRVGGCCVVASTGDRTVRFAREVTTESVPELVDSLGCGSGVARESQTSAWMDGVSGVA